jgi:hypothetical protein
MSDRSKLHFDPKQKTTIRPGGKAAQKMTVKASGSEKQDQRAPYKTTPKTDSGLGAKGR